MRYGLTAGGQRLRPVTALATADVLGRPPASLLPFAAALEMIHIHALIHADLPAIGDNHLRDGKPSAHVVFGESIALLAADALFAEALALIFREQPGEPARVLAASAQLMHEAGVAGLVGGLHADGSGTRHLADEELRQAYELQTDHLLAAAVGTVLILTGESGPAAVALRRFGAALGVLSQIVDDILDPAGGDPVLRTSRDGAAASRQEHLCQRVRPGARTRARAGVARARGRGARRGARGPRRAAELGGLHPRAPGVVELRGQAPRRDTARGAHS